MSMRPTSFIATAVCLTLTCSQALADRICPTNSFGIHDYRQPCFEVRGNVIYPTLPNSSVRDFSKPGFVIEPRLNETLIQPTYPGLNYPDYTKPGYRIEPYDNYYWY